MNMEFIVKKRIMEYTNELVYFIGVKNLEGGVRNELLAAITNAGLKCYDKLKEYKSIKYDGWTSVTLFTDKTEIDDFCDFLNSALILNSLKEE